MTTAWTTPGTWADGTVVTHTWINQQVRDNSEVIDQHSHSGAAGDGSQALGSLTVVTFANVGTAPTAVGTLVMNGTALQSHNGSSIVVLTNAAGVGTPSLRTVGSAGTQAANGTHVHTPTAVSVTGIDGNKGGTGGLSIGTVVYVNLSTANATTALATGNVTPGGTQRAVAIGYTVHLKIGGSQTGTLVYNLDRDGTSIGTVRQPFAESAGGSAMVQSLMWTDPYTAATARVYTLQGTYSGTNSNTIQILGAPGYATLGIAVFRTLPA
jgi:nicotinamide mononucleotide (NMN) deamidase PncC